MDQESGKAMDNNIDGEVEQETSGTNSEMEQETSDNVDEQDTAGQEEQSIEDELSNGHNSLGKETDNEEMLEEGEQSADNTTVNGYIGYDVDGNVVLAEGDFVVGIEEVVDDAASGMLINGAEYVAADDGPQEMDEDGDGRVLAYIAADDLDRLVGLAETEVGNTDDLDDPDQQVMFPDDMNGYGNHSDDPDDNEDDREEEAEEEGEEEEEEEYEDEDLTTEEVGESLETAEAEEPLAAEEVAEVSDERNLGLKFPLTRVKRIMKADPDLQLVSQDAVFLIAKATELFVEVVADAAFHHTLQAGRKTLLGRDLDSCIDRIDALAFLDGALDADQ